MNRPIAAVEFEDGPHRCAHLLALHVGGVSSNGHSQEPNKGRDDRFVSAGAARLLLILGHGADHIAGRVSVNQAKRDHQSYCSRSIKARPQDDSECADLLKIQFQIFFAEIKLFRQRFHRQFLWWWKEINISIIGPNLVSYFLATMDEIVQRPSRAVKSKVRTARSRLPTRSCPTLTT